MSSSKKAVYLLSTILGTVLVFKLFKSKRIASDFQFSNIEEKKVFEKEDTMNKVSEESVKEELNKRQKDILKLITKRKVVLPSDIYALHPNVSTRTLRRDMTTLVDLNMVKQEGSTRDTRYILKE